MTFYCSLGFKNLKSRDKVFVAGVVAADVVDVAGVTDADPFAAVLMWENNVLCSSSYPGCDHTVTSCSCIEYKNSL